MSYGQMTVGVGILTGILSFGLGVLMSQVSMEQAIEFTAKPGIYVGVGLAVFGIVIWGIEK